MYDERSAGYRWVVRLLKLGIFALAATIVGWYAMQFRAARPPATKSPAQQVAIMRDPNEGSMARRVAAEAIEVADPSVVAELTAELSGGDAAGRELAAQALGRLDTEDTGAIDALIAALDDPTLEVRQQAAIALGRIGARPEEVAAALIRRTRDADADVRRWAVIELGRVAGGSEAVEALRKCLSDSDPRVRAEAHAALWRHSAARVDELIAALRDADPLVQSIACTLLGRMGPDAEPAIPELAKVVAANGASAWNAGQTLLSVGKEDPQIISLLAPLLDSEDRSTAWQAARLFATCDHTTDALRERLLAHVDDPREHVADNIIKALHHTGLEGRLRPPELINALKEASSDVFSLVFQDDDILRDRMYGMSFYYSTRFPFVGSGITDEDLERLAGLNNVRLLDLSANPVGDAGLEQIARLEKLEWLLLYDTNVTSAGLAQVAKLPRLRSLALGGCKITDQGLESLKSLPSLEALDLRKTQVTDAGMQHLAGCRRLKALWLDETQITEAGLARLAALPALQDMGYSTKQYSLHGLAQLKGLVTVQPSPESVVDDDLALLADMPRLRELILTRSGITDAGLAHLAKLTQLESLWLGATAISDAGLARLGSLKNLKYLELGGTQTTERGREALQQALPNLQSPLVFGKAQQSKNDSRYEVVGLKLEEDPDPASVPLPSFGAP